MYLYKFIYIYFIYASFEQMKVKTCVLYVCILIQITVDISMRRYTTRRDLNIHTCCTGLYGGPWMTLQNGIVFTIVTFTVTLMLHHYYRKPFEHSSYEKYALLHIIVNYNYMYVYAFLHWWPMRYTLHVILHVAHVITRCSLSSLACAYTYRYHTLSEDNAAHGNFHAMVIHHLNHPVLIILKIDVFFQAGFNISSDLHLSIGQVPTKCYLSECISILLV
jgi:hypothetical protein